MIETICPCGWHGFNPTKELKTKVKNNLTIYYFLTKCPECLNEIK